MDKFRTYTLTKISIDEGKSSALESGYSTHGHVLRLFDYETNEERIIDDLDSVGTGWQIVLTNRYNGHWHRTSKIREIVSFEEEIMMFKTQTSLYRLEQTDHDTV